MGLGVSAATVPGPLIAYLVNIAAVQGWRKALLVVIAPLITDARIIVLMAFILGQLPAQALNLIQLAGGCLLLFIARGALRQYQAGRALSQVYDGGAAVAISWRRVLLTGIGMNFLSPGPWLFWGTVNGPLLLKAMDASAGHALAFLLAFYGSFLGGLCFWVLLIHQARRLPEDVLKYIILAMVLLLLWFGVGLITAAIEAEAFHIWIFIALIVGGLLLRARKLRQI
ncbi:MAG: LysE family transporter [Anaerolineae bacterium]|nr:LysE family transporter [Anaerolineae bacterium]